MIRINLMRTATIFLSLTCAATLMAQRGLKTIPDPDVKKQLASFNVAEGFEINLFAADPMFAKPIQMNWDARGRLWIASSSIYPQIKPGQKANDQIVVLEDTDDDGKADKRTVFADELLIPTAVIPYKSGAFVANSTELLFLDDTDGDGKADKRTVVLSGFGTEDTHHILHTFRWGPDGNLYMNQSIYIHSHVETPFGPRRLGAGGIWQFNPRTLRLEVMAIGLINSWGHHFDKWGQSFATDGAGGHGINYMFPGAAYPTAKFTKHILKGLNPGQPKLCGLEVISGRHIPEAYQGNLLGHDFRGHRTARFVLSDDGSGYASRRAEDLVSTSHGAFRPIDVKMGPDGAIYIADWYNPIIQHGEVDFRDERRDRTHGRIWRMTAKGRPLVDKPSLADASIAELLEHLKAPEQWTREQAKRVLAEADKAAVVSATQKWANAISGQSADEAQLLLEAAWVLQSHDVIDRKLIVRLSHGQEPRALAAAIRIVRRHLLDQPDEATSRWVTDLCELAVNHEHPRVRLEALHLLRRIGTLDSLRLAMQVTEKPLDTFLAFSLTQNVTENQASWVEPLKKGDQPFEKNAHLVHALKVANAKEASAALAGLINRPDISAKERISLLALMAVSGSGKELDRVLNEAGKASESDKKTLLKALAQSKGRPAQPNNIMALCEDAAPAVRQEAMRLAGRWRVKGGIAKAQSVIADKGAMASDQRAALAAIGLNRNGEARKVLSTFASQKTLPVQLRMHALTELAKIDMRAAIGPVKNNLPNLAGADPSELIQVYLSARGGPSVIAKHIKGVKLPADLAATAVRVIGSSGRRMEHVVKAFSDAGGLKPLPAKLSSKQLAALMAEVAESGNAARGEIIYRKQQIACVNCHAIGGAGGVVGPDLVSIGASAPVDYIIESLFEPNKKIKEGYHLTNVQTHDGKILIGMVTRKTEKEVILRDATGNETAIEAANIKNASIIPTSLMPPGLTMSLRRDEVVDLIRFLSELGKEGDFKVSTRRNVRRFRVIADSKQAAHIRNRNGIASFAQDPSAVTWMPAYAKVNGDIDVTSYPQFSWDKQAFSVLYFELEVSTPGLVGLRFSESSDREMWVDGVASKLQSLTKVNLSRGKHTFTLLVKNADKAAPFSIELIDLPGSEAKAQPVSGP